MNLSMQRSAPSHKQRGAWMIKEARETAMAVHGTHSTAQARNSASAGRMQVGMVELPSASTNTNFGRHETAVVINNTACVENAGQHAGQRSPCRTALHQHKSLRPCQYVGEWEMAAPKCTAAQLWPQRQGELPHTEIPIHRRRSDASVNP